jgi:hypothetical protein
MSLESWLMLAILIVMFALLIWNRFPALIIAGLVAEANAAGILPGMSQISIFDPTLIGLSAGVAGITLLLFIGTRLLAEPQMVDKEGVYG